MSKTPSSYLLGKQLDSRREIRGGVISTNNTRKVYNEDFSRLPVCPHYLGNFDTSFWRACRRRFWGLPVCLCCGICYRIKSYTDFPDAHDCLDNPWGRRIKCLDNFFWRPPCVPRRLSCDVFSLTLTPVRSF